MSDLRASTAIANLTTITQSRPEYGREKPGLGKNLGSRRLQMIASRNPIKVTACVPARLHLGFLDLDGGLGRRFGGIGVAISDLQTRIAIESADVMRISGPDSDRVARYIEVMRRDLGLDGAYQVDILDAVPSHSGLGSG